MSNEQVLWDRSGQPVFLIINGWLITPQGNMVGLIEQSGAVYTTRGQHTAWLSGGVLRDLYGHCMALCDRPEDPIHPQLPPRQLPPKIFWHAYPPPPAQQHAASTPPPAYYSWSILNACEIFC